MPFDELEQDQDETAMQPWRFGYRLPDEEGSESQPSIGMRIMQMATPQAQPDAPGPLRGIDALQQAAQGDPQPEPRLSIGQRIMQIGRQGVPPFDIQDGRPVWRQDPQTQQKPSIGQRIVRGASSETQASMPSTGYDLSSWETRPGMFANAGQSKTFMPQPVQGFSLLNSSRLEPSGQIYQHPELMSSLAAEADKDTVEEPAASSARTFKEGSAKGGGPEFLRGPLDFNEFASFVGGAKRGNSDPGKANPTAALVACVDFDGVIYLLSEYYQPGLSPRQHRPNLEQLYGFRSSEAMADPSIFYKTQAQADGTFKAIADLYVEEGILNLAPAPSNSELTGMERILNHWLDLDEREPTLKIVCPRNQRDIGRPVYGIHNDGCPNLLWELKRARREELNSAQLVYRNPTERIVDKDNHLRDCLKYLCLALPEATVKPAMLRAQEAVRGLDPTSAMIRWNQIIAESEQEEVPIAMGRRGMRNARMMRR